LGHGGRSTAVSAARTDHQANQQQSQRCSQRPLIALYVDLLLSIEQIMLRHRTEYGSQKSFEVLTLALETHVSAARGGGDGLQPALVQVRFYQRAGLVFDEAAALIGRQRDQIALGGADADRIDFESVLPRRFGGCSESVPFEIFAIRH